jgi:manganese efflux pump family protein
MGVAALITWLLTAGGGFFMLSKWVAKGGTRQPHTSSFPPALIFGHFALAATGLVLWIIYVITDTDALAWIAFILLVPVAALGFTMLARWLPTYRAGAESGRATVSSGRTGAASAGTTAAAAPALPPEGHFPVPVVIAHCVFAVVTVVLVLLTALGVGS